MAALGSLVVQLALNYAQFTGGLDKSEQAALAASKKVQDTFDGMKAKLAVTAGAIAGGLAAAFTIGAFKSLISSTIEADAALSDLAVQTGATVEALSGLEEVGRFSATSADTIAQSMGKLTRILSGTADETKGAGKAVAALGLDFDTFRKLKPEDQLQSIAKAMDGFKDSTGKSAVAQALFGEQGAKLLPFFKDLAAAGDLQVRTTDEQAASSKNFGDNMLRLQITGELWKKELAQGIIPALDIGVQAFLDITNGSGGFRDEIKKLSDDGSIQRWTSEAIKDLSYVIDVLEGIKRTVGTVGDAIGAVSAWRDLRKETNDSVQSKVLSLDLTGAWAEIKKFDAAQSAIIDSFKEGFNKDWTAQSIGQKWRERADAIAAGAAQVRVAEKKANDDKGDLKFHGANSPAAKADTAAINDALAAQIAAIQGRDKLQVQNTKNAVAEITSARKLGSISEIDAIDATADAEIKSLTATRANLVEELAVNEKKQNGLKDVAATRAKIAEQDATIAGREKQYNRDLLESYAAINAAADKRLDQAFQDTNTLKKQLDDAKFEGAAIGQTAAAVRNLDIARANELATAKERLAFTRDAINGNTIEGDQLRAQAKLIREIAGQKGQNSIAQEASAEWKNFTDSLYNGLTDSLYRGFEAGGKFFKTFWDGLKNTIKTTVLKFGIQAIFSIAGGGGVSLANAATGGANAASSIGNMVSLGKSALNWFTNFGASATGSISSAGAGLAHTGLDTVGHALFDNAATIGSGLETLGTGLGYLNSVLAISRGKWGEGVGSAIGTYFGGPIGAVIGSTLGKMLDKAFGGETRIGGQYGVAVGGQVVNNRRGETYTREGQQFNRDGGGTTAVTNGNAYLIEADGLGAQDGAVRQAVADTAKGINAALLALGSKATIAGFSAGLETSGKGRGGVFSGGSLNSGALFGESGKGTNVGGDLYESTSSRSPDAKTAIANFTLDLKQVTIEALQAAIDIPESIKAMIKDVDAEGLTDEAATALLTAINGQIVAVQGFRDAVKGLPFENLKTLSFDAAEGLAAASGGFDKLQTNLSSYYDNYYSEAERSANLTRQLGSAFESLGTSVPQTRDAFRALVDAQDLSTASGRNTYAALLGLSDAFASVTAAAGDAGAATAAAAQAEVDLASKRAAVQDQIDALKGNDRAVLDRQRALQWAAAAVDPAMRTLLDELWHLQDAATAAADAARAAADAQAAVQKAQDDALAGLQRAVDAQKTVVQGIADVAQESVTNLQSVFSTLKSNVADLYGQITATQLQNVVTSRAFITQALATARSSGYLPDGDQLTSAIAGARSGLDPNNYATQQQYDRDRLVLAGQLDALKGLTGTQLTNAEMQLQVVKDELRRLDAVLQQGKDLVDAARGIDTSVLTVTDALNRLIALVGGTSANAGGASAGGAVVGGTVGAGSGGPQSSGIGKQSDGSYRFSAGYVISTITGSDASRIAGLDSIYASYAGTGDVAGYYRAAKAAGFSLRDIAAHDGYYYGDVLAAAAAAGVPAFASGGSFAGGLRMVGERGPELEVTGPARIYSAAQTAQMLGGGNAELIAEVRAVRAEMAALRSEAADSAKAAKETTRILNQYTQGGRMQADSAFVA